LKARWNRDWIITYRLITKATNERTFLPTVMPLGGFGNSVAIVLLDKSSFSEAHCLIANLSAFVFDYVVRQKLGGNNMSFGTTQQLPVVPKDTFSRQVPWLDCDSDVSTSISAWLLPRVLELVYTAWDVAAFARDCEYAGAPFQWIEERRFMIRSELDAALFHLYFPADKCGEWLPAPSEATEDLALIKAKIGAPRKAVDYIMEAFPIVKRKDNEVTANIGRSVWFLKSTTK
jgi:hypothetical protein